MYKIDPIVKRSVLEIVVCTGDQKLEYCSGIELSKAQFDKRYVIDRIYAENERIIIDLKEADINSTDWCQDKDVGFF
ncbi:MAG: hypothetical protein ACLVAU_04345 [Ruminococcus sp.]